MSIRFSHCKPSFSFDSKSNATNPIACGHNRLICGVNHPSDVARRGLTPVHGRTSPPLEERCARKVMGLPD